MTTSVPRVRVGIPQELSSIAKALLNLWMAVIGRRTVGSNFCCSDEEADCFRPVVPGEEEGVIDRVVFGSGRN
jgi:hypothetical protein